jgi:hypothetical protein
VRGVVGWILVQWRFPEVFIFSYMSCSFSLQRSAPSPREEIELRDNLVRGEGWGEGMDKFTLIQRARDLRRNSTAAEKHLWYNLRANRLGFKFKRQVPVGAYIYPSPTKIRILSFTSFALGF